MNKAIILLTLTLLGPALHAQERLLVTQLDEPFVAILAVPGIPLTGESKFTTNYDARVGLSSRTSFRNADHLFYDFSGALDFQPDSVGVKTKLLWTAHLTYATEKHKLIIGKRSSINGSISPDFMSFASVFENGATKALIPRGSWGVRYHYTPTKNWEFGGSIASYTLHPQDSLEFALRVKYKYIRGATYLLNGVPGYTLEYEDKHIQTIASYRDDEFGIFGRYSLDCGVTMAGFWHLDEWKNKLAQALVTFNNPVNIGKGYKSMIGVGYNTQQTILLFFAVYNQ